MPRVPSRRNFPDPEPDRSAERATRRHRAEEEPLDVRWEERGPRVHLIVRNPVHGTRYDVYFPEYPGRDSSLCTCTDFARRDLGTCKHVEAAWSWLREHPPQIDPSADRHDVPGTERLWSEFDRRRERWGSGGPGSIREIEKAGAVLLDGPTAAATADGEAKETVGVPPRARSPPTRRTSRGRP